MTYIVIHKSETKLDHTLIWFVKQHYPDIEFKCDIIEKDDMLILKWFPNHNIQDVDAIILCGIITL